MLDHSPYEGFHEKRQEQAFGACLGVVRSVDAANRLCAVSTFLGDGSLNDQVIPKCQWLSLDSNPDGDELGCIPRRGSIGLVFFIGGEVFVWGFLRPLSENGNAAQGAESPTLTEGDKIISTKAGNRLTIKKSGLVELFAKDTLQRVMFPLGSKIIDICRAYNLQTDAGEIIWNSNELLQTALYDAEFRQTVARALIIHDQKGYISPTLISKTTVGAALPGVRGTSTPSYVQTIGVDGTLTTSITPPGPEGLPVGFNSVVKPDGSISIKAGALQTTEIGVDLQGAVKLSVNKISEASISAAGDVLVKNALSKIAITSSGDITVTSGTATLKIAVSGEVTLDTVNKITLSPKAGLDIKSLGPVNIEGVGPMNIKTKGIINIDGGTGASDFVLTNPTTLSPFTGAPLAPFSTTVKVSK